MKNTYILYGGIAIFLIALIGFFVFDQQAEEALPASEAETSVEEVETAVNELETELQALEQQIADGALTSEDAAEAETRIFTLLGQINTVTEDTDTATLTTRERDRLGDALDRLQTILEEYLETFEVLEETTPESSEAGV